MVANPTQRSSRRPWVYAVAGIVAVVVVLVGIKALQIRAMIGAGRNFTLPPESVTSAKVEAQEWEATRAAVGTLVAVRAVTLGSEVPGTVREIGFESGAFVHKGDVLVRLDISTEEAQLAAAQADASLARTTAHRAEKLREANTNTPADLDAAEARNKGGAATVASLQAIIAKKTIRAPFDGRLGIRQVELGQVLSSGAPIVSLQSVHPIHAEFWLPQQALSELKAGMRARMSTDVFPKQTWEGVITTVTPEVDIATRNVRVRATFPNQDGRLRPGMFANVEVIAPDKRQVLVIPATSIIYAPFGDSVFAIEPKDKGLVAKQKFVRLGERRGDLATVVSGLNAGETIVATGAFKLRNGSGVIVRSDLAPSGDKPPQPGELQK